MDLRLWGGEAGLVLHRFATGVEVPTSSFCTLQMFSGKDGVKEMAKESELDFLGEIPLHLDIRTCADEGRPIVVSHPNSPQTDAYRDLAEKIASKLQI